VLPRLSQDPLRGALLLGDLALALRAQLLHLAPHRSLLLHHLALAVSTEIVHALPQLFSFGLHLPTLGVELFCLPDHLILVRFHRLLALSEESIRPF